MSSELTALLKGPSERPPIQSNTTFTLELAYVTFCIFLKIIYYYLRFYTPRGVNFILVLVLCEVSNNGASVPWSEIELSVHGAVYEQYCEIVNDQAMSDESKKDANRANKKATSIADAIRVRLEIIDLAISSLMSFSRTGGGLVFTISASVLVLFLPWAIQRVWGLDKLVSEVIRNKDETKGVTDVDDQKRRFNTYLHSYRALIRNHFARRSCIAVIFGLLVLVASPSEPQQFALILPLILHPDEKWVKLWKAMSEADNTWKLLENQHPCNSAQEALTSYLPKAMQKGYQHWNLGATYKCHVSNCERDLEAGTSFDSMRSEQSRGCTGTAGIHLDSAMRYGVPLSY